MVICPTQMKPRTPGILSDHEKLRQIMKWVAYYRKHFSNFVYDYLGITCLKWFQDGLLEEMEANTNCMYLAARGQGKTYLIALYICCRCILYPKTRVVIAAGFRNQSAKVIQKIIGDIMMESPNLAMEIKNYSTNETNPFIDFRNGSTVRTATAKESARSMRSHILIIDEFRMVDLSVITTVLRRFNAAPRQPRFMDKPKYKNYPLEMNKEFYLSSAWYTSHWSYEKMIDYARKMLAGKQKYFVCALPYQLSIQERLYSAEAAQNEMSESDFNELLWSMEMECLWYGDKDGSFFHFDTISANQTIDYPMLPSELSSMIKSDKISIKPKQHKEIRILSADTAVMPTTKRKKNDATSIFINSLTPTKGQRYISNIIYGDVFEEGMHTLDQAAKIRRLYEEYECDYIVIDIKGVGFGIADTLLRDIVDPLTGERYPPLSCCNDPTFASRCTDPHAPKVIWAIQATQKFNNDCAVRLREGFRSNRIRLLKSQNECEELLSALKGFNSLSVQSKSDFMKPYYNTAMFINETINLDIEINGTDIKVHERSGKRKDRYSSLSYNYWVACELEAKLRRNHSLTIKKSDFTFRAPNTKAKGGALFGKR